MRVWRVYTSLKAPLINILVIDALLFNLLEFMKTLVTDTANEIRFVFNDYDDDHEYKYNAMASDEVEIIINYDDPANATHVNILNNF